MEKGTAEQVTRALERERGAWDDAEKSLAKQPAWADIKTEFEATRRNRERTYEAEVEGLQEP